MTEWYFGNSSGPRDWEKKNRNPYGFNPYSPYNWRKSLKHYVDTLERFLNHEDVKKKIAKGERVVAKVKRGDKIYRMTIEDITPDSEDDKITIEFEDSPLDKHPDYTE
tara:strand:- start:379 stop:702 length:324 start_codon:yes stop_codon:yes gene_type:complete